MVGHQPGPQPVAAGAAPRGLQIGEHSGEGERLGLAVAPLELKAEEPVAGAVEKLPPDVRVEFLPGERGIKGQLLGQLLENGVALDDHPLGAEAPWLDRSVFHRLRGVRHDELGLKLERLPEAAALRAGTFGVIPGEMPRRERLVDGAANHTGEPVAQGQLPPATGRPIFDQDDRAVIPLAEGELQRIGEAAALVGAQHDPVDHDLHADGLRLRVDEVTLIEPPHLAVEPHPLEAPLLQPRQLLPEDRRLRLHPGREYHHAAPRRLGENPLEAIVERAALD